MWTGVSRSFIINNIQRKCRYVQKIISMYSDEAATPDTPTYKVNDKAVSKSKYERTLKNTKTAKPSFLMIVI